MNRSDNLNGMIIAEIGSVHDGSFGNAQKLIEIAAESGADCAKFQTHIASAESLQSAPNPKYFDEEPRIEYFERTSFSIEQWKKLKKTADKCNVLFLSSPFSIEAVDLLEKIGMFAYKIPSGEVTNLPLLEKIAELGKPVFLSSGMSNWQELDSAVNLLKNRCELTVMQCSSAYPCPPEQVGLNVISEIKERYNSKVGFSDHTLGSSASISAAALGATVIEKHLTFSKYMYGSDAKHSMEPNEFASFCKDIKNVWNMIDNPVEKNNIALYRGMKSVFQKSIVIKYDIPKGMKIKMKHLSFKKPGDGIPASEYKNIIGKETVYDLSKNQVLKIEDIL